MRTAVILVGELRAWLKAAKCLFDYFDHQEHQIDYFFVTWNTTRTFWWPEEKSSMTTRDVNAAEIVAPFVRHEKNLVDYMIVEYPNRENLSFYYQGYLSQYANKLKRGHEKAQNYVYDHVVEMRPDLFIREPYAKWDIAEDNVLFGGPVWPDQATGKMMMQDFYYRSNSATNNILAERYTYRPQGDPAVTPTENEQLIISWLSSRGVVIKPHNDYGFNFIIRPNFPKDLAGLTMEQAKTLDQEWIAYQWS